MLNTGLGQVRDDCSPLEAEPVRRWLLGFFRRRVRNTSDVEDLVQDVFVRIASRNSAEPIENLAAYVLRTAVNVLGDRSRRWRSRRVDLHVPFEAEQHSVEEISPERVFAGRQELNEVTAALLSLPPRTRDIFILRRVEGMKHREIAQQFGITVSAVEKHMVKAVRHLSSQLETRLGS